MCLRSFRLGTDRQFNGFTELPPLLQIKIDESVKMAHGNDTAQSMHCFFISIKQLINLKVSGNSDLRYKNHYCYYRSLYWYDFWKTIHPSGNYKVNIVLNGHTDWAHACLTKNDKVFLKARHKIPFKIEKIGEKGKFNYWITL
jgi:hypothetical protein